MKTSRHLDKALSGLKPGTYSFLLSKKANSQEEPRMGMLEYSPLLMVLAKLASGKMMFHGANSANMRQVDTKSYVRVSTKAMARLVAKPRLLLQIIKARLQELIELPKL